MKLNVNNMLLKHKVYGHLSLLDSNVYCINGY